MLATSFLFLHDAWQRPTGAIVSYSADAMEQAWFMRWTPYALLHGSNPMYTEHIVYPSGANLAWNTTEPLIALLFAPLTLILGPVFTVNLSLTVELALTAWLGSILCGRYTTSRIAALLGGIMIGFGPFEVTQVGVGHIHTGAGMYPVIVLLLLDEILVRRRYSPWRLGAVLGAASGLQLYVWEETLACTAILAVIGVALLALLSREVIGVAGARLARAVLGAVPPLLILGGPLLLYEFRGPDMLHGSLLPAGSGDGDLFNLLLPNQFAQLTLGHSIEETFPTTGFEPGLYIGLPLLAAICGATVLLRRRRPEIQLFFVMFVVSVTFALGSTLHIGGTDTGISLPWRLFSHLPLLLNLLPVRFALFEDLFAALVVVIAIDEVLKVRVRDTREFLLLGIGIGCLALLPTFDLAAKPLDDPYVFQTDAASHIAEGSVVLVAPIAGDITDPHGVTVEPMLWQAQEGMKFRMPEGYVRHPTSDGQPTSGPDHSPLLDAMVSIDTEGGAPTETPALRAQFLAELRTLTVGTIVVGPMRFQLQMLAFVRWLTGGDGTPDGNVVVWYHWNQAAE